MSDLGEARSALRAAEAVMRRNGDDKRASAWTAITLAWVRIHEAAVGVETDTGETK